MAAGALPEALGGTRRPSYADDEDGGGTGGSGPPPDQDASFRPSPRRPPQPRVDRKAVAVQKRPASFDERGVLDRSRTGTLTEHKKLNTRTHTPVSYTHLTLPTKA